MEGLSSESEGERERERVTLVHTGSRESGGAWCARQEHEMSDRTAEDGVRVLSERE